MTMREVTEQMVNEVNEAIDFAFKKMFENVNIMNISADEFELMQKYKGLMNTSEKLLLLNADMMDQMNKKLDMLLEQKKEA